MDTNLFAIIISKNGNFKYFDIISDLIKLEKNESKEIDPKIQYRIIEFVNNAKRDKDITKRTKISKELAKDILSHRKKLGPFGFATIEKS